MTLWMVRAGQYGENEQDALDKNLVTIGFYELSDLSQIKSREDLKEVMDEPYSYEKNYC